MDGQLILYVTYTKTQNGKTSVTKHCYDYVDGVLTRIISSQDGRIISYQSLDGSLYRPKRLIHYRDGKGDGWTDYQRDDRGNVIKRIEYNEQAQVTGWSDMEYDSNGNQTLEVNYNQAGEEWARRTRTFTAQGELLTDLYIINGELAMDMENVYEYDAVGRPVRH